MIIDNIDDDDFEEMKVAERVVTEIPPSMYNEEKMLVSSSEKKFKNSNGINNSISSSSI
jgi:hypothetical protein